MRKRGSGPKLLPLNTALATVVMGWDEEALASSSETRGRIAETSLGGFLYRCASENPDCEVGYWRAGDSKVDFVFTSRGEVYGIEGYCVGRGHTRSGMNQFRKKFPYSKAILVGKGGLPLEEVLSMNHSEFLEVLNRI